MSSDEDDVVGGVSSDEDYGDYHDDEDLNEFYLDDDEDDEDTFVYRSSIVEVSAEFIDMILAFVQQPNLNSINVNTQTGQTYFMHAIAAKRMDIVHKFINYNIDLNASDENNWTPLHYAVSGNNIEFVCLLLSYGVDVRIKSNDDETPLALAYLLKREEIVKYLLNYYYEFANVNLTKIKIVYKCWFQDLNPDDIILLILAMYNGYVEEFKMIWTKCDVIFSVSDDRFLQKCLCNFMYTPVNKSDCLYSFEMTDVKYMFETVDFFLQNAFLSPKFDQTRRMDLLFLCLSTGVHIEFLDIHRIFYICGFNKELEALIYAANYDWDQYVFSYYNVLLDFILNFNHNTSTYPDFCKKLKNMHIYRANHIIPWLKYFALPPDVKCGLVKSVRPRQDEVLLKSVRKVTECPSLLELGRLAVQNLIKQTYNITKPYQFYDAVKQLRLPEHLKDIVLFKRPIYE